MSAALSVILVWLMLALSPPSAAASGRPVVFTAGDGTPLAGLLYEASRRPAPGVVLVHMLGRSKEEWAPIAERLQNAGMTALVFDLRGHGASGGDGGALDAMVEDVRSAVRWMASRSAARPDGVAVVGASLGANLAALAAADIPWVRAVGLVSPSLDYRGVRLDAGTMRKLAGRRVWMAASTQDPYAVRTVKELTASGAPVEERLSPHRAHGTALLQADPELSSALVDWLVATLIF